VPPPGVVGVSMPIFLVDRTGLLMLMVFASLLYNHPIANAIAHSQTQQQTQQQTNNSNNVCH
jgi:hypothetical protein